MALQDRSLQYFTLETVACRRTKSAFILFRCKELQGNSLQRSSLISFVNYF
jgi:hypothetical protein